MMQTRSMVNKPNLTVEIPPYVLTESNGEPRKRQRIPRKTDYKSIIQTRSQKLLVEGPVVFDSQADSVPDSVPGSVPNSVPGSVPGSDPDSHLPGLVLVATTFFLCTIVLFLAVYYV